MFSSFFDLPSLLDLIQLLSFSLKSNHVIFDLGNFFLFKLLAFFIDPILSFDFSAFIFIIGANGGLKLFHLLSMWVSTANPSSIKTDSKSLIIYSAGKLDLNVFLISHASS